MAEDTPKHRKAFASRSGDTRIIASGNVRNIDEEAREEARRKAEAAAAAKSKAKPAKPARDTAPGADT